MIKSGPSQINSPRNEQLLFEGRGLNFQSTADQVLQKVFTGTEYSVSRIVGVRRTGGATVTCLGGIYTETNKSGIAIVTALQSWLGITGNLGQVLPTLASLGAVLNSSPLYFSLTTGSLGACTGDILVYGAIVD